MYISRYNSDSLGQQLGALGIGDPDFHIPSKQIWETNLIIIIIIIRSLQQPQKGAKIYGAVWVPWTLHQKPAIQALYQIIP